MAIFAAAQYAMYGLVAYIASGPHLRSPWLRLLIAAPVCAIPLAYTQVNNDLVTVQFFGLYGAFWTVLWIPGTRAGRILAPLVMATVSWTAVLSVVFFPLIIARLIVDRSKSAWALAILWASGVWLQLSETVLGRSHHDMYGFNGLPFVVKNYITRVVPRALFGERSLGGAGVDYRGEVAVPLHVTSVAGHDALIVCAWAVVLLIVVLAAIKFTDPNWTLAGVAALFSVGIFVDELLINTAIVQPRYVIAPALLRGAIVLSDRFLDSSTVYQGIARNLAADPVAQINRFAVGEVMPDLTVVIDVPHEVSLARLKQRASDLPDRMERENIDFYKKVREGYLVLAKGMPERFIVVDGTKSEDAIEKKIWTEVQARVK